MIDVFSGQVRHTFETEGGAGLRQGLHTGANPGMGPGMASIYRHERNRNL